MAKIVKLETKTYPGKDPSTTVVLDNGISGYLQKDSDLDLKEGESVEVTTKPYTSKAGKVSTLVTLKRDAIASAPPKSEPPIVPPKPQIHVGTGKSKEEMKSEAVIRVGEKVFDAFFEGKLESAEISLRVKEFSGLLKSEINDIYSEK
jgi:hypothetical protein